jgi:cytoskeletal protein CcmA (bactofilin family)
MSALLAASALFLAFFLLLALPLTPACLELFYKTDDAPLKVVQQHAGDIRFFADGFRHYLAQIQANLDECELYGTDALIVMPDRIPCLVLAQRDSPHDFAIDGDKNCSKVIASIEDLELPAETTFEKDIYARRRLQGGIGNHYRAILGERDVQLADSSVVMRWVHAVGDIDCAPNCRLYGRISSERSIRLHAGCVFTRLNAPRIELGNLPTDSIPAVENTSDRYLASGVMERVLHDGDFQVAAGEVFAKHLVVRGTLRVGEGARMLGNVKAQKGIILESGVFAYGSLISAATLSIGPHCRLQGPLIAEHTITIDSSAIVGDAEAPTTVSAPRIEVAEGAVAFGTLWAREKGQVVARA